MHSNRRNDIIDECINTVKSLIHDNCSDHTPYRGACVSCGRVDNPDVLPDPDTVIKKLESLKEEGFSLGDSENLDS